MKGLTKENIIILSICEIGQFTGNSAPISPPACLLSTELDGRNPDDSDRYNGRLKSVTFLKMSKAVNIYQSGFKHSAHGCLCSGLGKHPPFPK
jgi:hypothetical protein